jgi:hypothetical protein
VSADMALAGMAQWQASHASPLLHLECWPNAGRSQALKASMQRCHRSPRSAPQTPGSCGKLSTLASWHAGAPYAR